MSIIEFDEKLITYMSQVFWRYIKIETKKIVKDIHKYLDEDWYGDFEDDGGVITRRCDFKTSNYKFEVSFEVEKEYDDEDEFKKSTITIFIKLKYKSDDIDFFYNYGIDMLESFKDDYEKYEKTIYDWLKTSVFKKIIICKHCEKCRAVDGEDLCEECFIFWYKHDDMCPWCHDDEGVFIKLECGHIYHKKCWDIYYFQEIKSRKVKCMICRKIVDKYSIYERYPLESL